MGQKVHPRAFRLNTVKTWDSKWFARKSQFADQLRTDVLVRAFLMRSLREASVASIEIERSGSNVVITVRSAKPGFVIGRGGTGAEELKRKLMLQFFKGKKVNVQLNIVEVTKPSLSATIVAQQIATDTEKRMPFRRLMKQAIDRVEKGGAEGVKIRMSGRLGGAEIARREQLSSGKIPLQNLRADIDFGQATAHTIYGTVGVTVWINRGEVFEKSV
ncbi:MAG: 30S ribosomal protein S3 [bacterium]|nr:30S ribosomal protein S3 [bacterium]